MKYKIAGKSVHVFDDLISKKTVHHIDQILEASWFNRSEYSSDEAKEDGHYHFAGDFQLDRYQKSLFCIETELKIKQLFGKFKLIRAYINAQTFGNQTFIHRDDQSKNPITLMGYIGINGPWSPDWGGETIFYDENLEPKLTILPKRGRFIIFDGRISHVGRSPEKIYSGCRYTLAAKYTISKQ